MYGTTKYAIIFTQQEAGWFFVTYVLPIFFLLALWAIRRKFRTWRALGGKTWFTREYEGETTWWPTYRRRNTLVWVDADEVDRACYKSTSACKKETGRHARRAEKEAKLIAAEAKKAKAAAAKPAVTTEVPADTIAEASEQPAAPNEETPARELKLVS